MQLNDRLFPIRSSPDPVLKPLGLSLPSLSPNLFDLDVEQGFHCQPHIRLRRVAMNLKSVLIISRRPVDALFGYQRLQQDLMGFKLNLPFDRRGWQDMSHDQFTPLAATASWVFDESSEPAKVPSLILSSASLVNKIRFGFRTLNAFNWRTGSTETPVMFRPLL